MPPYMNPINDFYFRNSQPHLTSQPYQQTFNFPPPVNQMQIYAKWVTNVEEARASQMNDFMSVNLFLDTGTGKIYLKKIDDNGKPVFLSYSLDEEIKKEDPLSEINKRLTHIENYLGGMKNESIPNNASVQQSPAVYESAVTIQDARNDEAESTGLPKNYGNDKWQKRRRNEADCYEPCESERYRP